MCPHLRTGHLEHIHSMQGQKTAINLCFQVVVHLVLLGSSWEFSEFHYMLLYLDNVMTVIYINYHKVEYLSVCRISLGLLRTGITEGNSSAGAVQWCGECTTEMAHTSKRMASAPRTGSPGLRQCQVKMVPFVAAHASPLVIHSGSSHCSPQVIYICYQLILKTIFPITLK